MTLIVVFGLMKMRIGLKITPNVTGIAEVVDFETQKLNNR